MIVSLPSIDGSDVADHYDQLNALYIDVWGNHRHHGFWEKGNESADAAIALMAQRVVQAAKLGAGGSVVDVGCGTGGIACLLADQAQAEVMAYTLSREEKLAAENSAECVGEGRVHFVCADWLDNDLPDEWADAVVMIESFSHMQDRRAVLSEIARVLKPGGRLVLADWVISAKPRKWQVKRLLEPMCRGGRLAGLSTLDENRNLLESLFFQIKESSDITLNVKKTWWVIAARLMGKVLIDADCRQLIWQSLLRDRDRFFAIPRVMIAYQLDCLKYGWLVAEKGSCAGGGIEAEVRP